MSGQNVSRNALTESQAREEICRVGKSLFDRGYAHATAGNISVRLHDGFLITPTDACLGFLDPATLAKLDLNGQQLSGAMASKTIGLHRAIYQANQSIDPKTACIIHTHSAHCVALSLREPVRIRSASTLGASSYGASSYSASSPDASSSEASSPGSSAEVTRAEVTRAEVSRAEITRTELLPALTPYFVMKVGRVPLIEYHRPGSASAAQAVAERIAEYAAQNRPLRAVMLARLGPNVWHQAPATAMAVLEELEETAKLFLAQPHTEALSEAQIEDLRQTFGARW